VAARKKKSARKASPAGPVERVKKICLAFPEAKTKTSHGHLTFTVNDKVFGYYTVNHHDDGRLALWCKGAPGAQQLVVESDPKRFFVPPYVGVRGWIGIRVDIPPVDWATVAALLEESWRMTAPKRLL
jgi:hypothetical protein